MVLERLIEVDNSGVWVIERIISQYIDVYMFGVKKLVFNNLTKALMLFSSLW
jgi:hypothetical protein